MTDPIVVEHVIHHIVIGVFSKITPRVLGGCSLSAISCVMQDQSKDCIETKSIIRYVVYSRYHEAGSYRCNSISHERQHLNHLADGPAQQARDAAFAGEDPLAHNGWIYGHDAEQPFAGRTGQSR